MASEEYLKAQKMGIKAYKSSIAKGQYPYLPVLDEILSHAEVEYEVSLGTIDIPLDQVVGTSTFGRTQAFASNFMPLLGTDSEFSFKWSSLCDYQMNEGIQDAIKVYEYLNKFYVVEGNKRVSVLKFFNCPSILAEVIRKVPKRNDDPVIRIYYEFMDFYELTQINYVNFTQLGSYAKLLSLTSKSNTRIWTKDEQRDFASMYAEFSKIYFEKGGNQFHSITVSDALLLYLTVYPYDEVLQETTSQLKSRLDKMWPEIALLGKTDSVELLMDPSQDKSTPVSNVLNMIIQPKKKRVAFVYDKEPASSDWIYGHELGRMHLEDIFKDRIETRTYIIDLDKDDADDVLLDICKDGNNIIFTVTPKLINACLRAAIDHPNITILNCSLNSSYNTVRTYYTRMYEAKFLTGMIAGAMCTNNKIGYVADYPLYGAAASINAFALGAKMVNPHVNVYLAWTTLKDFDVDQYFKKENVTYISAQDMITPQNTNRTFGLYEETEYGKKNLAMSIYDWGEFYERLLNSMERGSWKAEESVENKAINYWWGLSAGVIEVICSGNLPSGTVKLVKLMEQAISSGLFHPFTGPLTDQNRDTRYESANAMKPEDIMKMDWLVENVIGKIPTIDELKEEAQPVVLLRGLHATTADKGGNT